MKIIENKLILTSKEFQSLSADSQLELLKLTPHGRNWANLAINNFKHERTPWFQTMYERDGEVVFIATKKIDDIDVALTPEEIWERLPAEVLAIQINGLAQELFDETVSSKINPYKNESVNLENNR